MTCNLSITTRSLTTSVEDTFYREGLANFTEADFENAGYGATFYNNLKEVSMDESTHVTFLTSALQGKTPLT